MDRTKYYKNGYLALAVIDIFLTFGPILGFGIYGFITAEVARKVVLGIVATLGIVLGTIAALSKYTFRGAIFLVLFGLYLAIGEIGWILLVIGLCTIVDEIIVQPLKKHMHDKYKINKEYDIREMERNE